MSLKSFVESLFSKKGKPVEEPVVDPSKRFCEEKCAICNDIIGPLRYKKVQGTYFHKSCFKRKMRQTMGGK